MRNDGGLKITTVGIDLSIFVRVYRRTFLGLFFYTAKEDVELETYFAMLQDSRMYNVDFAPFCSLDYKYKTLGRIKDAVPEVIFYTNEENFVEIASGCDIVYTDFQRALLRNPLRFHKYSGVDTIVQYAKRARL